MTFSNLSTTDAGLGFQSHEMDHLYVVSHPRTWTQSRESPDVDRDNATTVGPCPPLQDSAGLSQTRVRLRGVFVKRLESWALMLTWIPARYSAG